MAVLCTDAGHGARDSGAAWQNILEKDLNLTFTLALNAGLSSRGHRVFTTRENDTQVPPLATRCRLINAHHQSQNPRFDAIVSLHCNVAATLDAGTNTYKAIPSHRGFYAIYSQESEGSVKLAKSIAESCSRNHIELNHGGMLSTIQLGRSLAWIHKTLPAAVLLELGFMTNPDELKLLQDADYQQTMVRAIAEGLEKALS